MSTPARVLITGGSTGIGFGLAQRFAARGSQVVITGRDHARLQQAASRIPDLITISGDLSKPDDRITLASAVGSIDMLINNVASASPKTPLLGTNGSKSSIFFSPHPCT